MLQCWTASTTRLSLGCLYAPRLKLARLLRLLMLALYVLPVANVGGEGAPRADPPVLLALHQRRGRPSGRHEHGR